MTDHAPPPREHLHEVPAIRHDAAIPASPPLEVAASPVRRIATVVSLSVLGALIVIGAGISLLTT
ncbi:hypothetical protein [Homoserinibacter sp. YIM 151385]|uniref:hypothetical protein n=1 Tax=Homoserinibacter sp. YIM 151385 TaxID=2985506 RepID=UPI0022F034C2|nr:hypothetical protein [Homoserinibacter sp. YIM 151385]WBU38399.1 hypothetical protein OF852_02100 [Homoserinibacter sp. YIM 151385]